MSLPAARRRVVEVGPRDGLQNEAAALTVDDQVGLLRSACSTRACAWSRSAPSSRRSGCRRWRARTRSARRVRRAAGRAPAGAGAEPPGVRGGARRRRAREIAVFTAASETFNRKNINACIDESFARFAEFVPEALARRHVGARLRLHLLRLPVRGPCRSREGGGGRAAPARRSAATRSRSATPSASAVPTQVTDVMGRLQARDPAGALAVHFHDTRGTALANVLAALQAGIAIVDSSAGGLGGCPYAPGRQRQPGHRGPALHARTAWASRPASTSPPFPPRPRLSERSSTTRSRVATSRPVRPWPDLRSNGGAKIYLSRMVMSRRTARTGIRAMRPHGLLLSGYCRS